jgi:hypothetical protein
VTATRSRRADETYALGLCDEIVGSASIREARFDWLRGDPGRNGVGTRLPVDAYWPDLGLVVEFYEYQHDHATPFFDKPDKLTVSGVPRREQRARYDRRRAETLPAHGLTLVVLRKADLACGPSGRLVRDEQRDRAVVRAVLGPHLGFTPGTGDSTARSGHQ